MFFFDGTGRGGVFFFFEGRDGTVVFEGGNFFGGTGQNRYTVKKAVYTVPPAVHVKPGFRLFYAGEKAGNDNVLRSIFFLHVGEICKRRQSCCSAVP